MKGTSGAGVSAIQTRLQASTQFWSVDSSSVIRDSACMIAMADARSGMFFGTKGSCPRRRSRLNGGWRVPAKSSNWPSAVSCNRHTQLEPRKAAIGSTRPTTAVRTATTAMTASGVQRTTTQSVTHRPTRSLSRSPAKGRHRPPKPPFRFPEGTRSSRTDSATAVGR
jgi:hypothetical protein